MENGLKEALAYAVGLAEPHIVQCDGGAWKNEAMQSIKQYLEEQLKDIDFVTVIA